MSEDGKSGAIKFKGLIQKPKMGVTKQHIIFMHTKKTNNKKKPTQDICQKRSMKDHPESLHSFTL